MHEYPSTFRTEHPPKSSRAPQIASTNHVPRIRPAAKLACTSSHFRPSDDPLFPPAREDARAVVLDSQWDTSTHSNRRSLDKLILDLDSSVSEIYGHRERQG